MKPNPLWIAAVIVCFGIGYFVGENKGRHDNEEIRRLWSWVNTYESTIALRDLEITTREETIHQFRLRLMECEAAKTKVKP